MIARTTAVIEAGGVLGELTCAPPLTLRQVHSDVRGRCELRLVGTAAGPLAGDDLSVGLRLRPGAQAHLAATGASLAQAAAAGVLAARRLCRSARTWPPGPTWSPTPGRWSSARAAGWTSASSWRLTAAPRCGGAN